MPFFDKNECLKNIAPLSSRLIQLFLEDEQCTRNQILIQKNESVTTARNTMVKLIKNYKVWLQNENAVKCKNIALQNLQILLLLYYMQKFLP